MARYTAICYGCDDRPLCPRCGRPIQLGRRGACPEPYGRGVVVHFSSAADLDTWVAAHPTTHRLTATLRVTDSPGPDEATDSAP